MYHLTRNPSLARARLLRLRPTQLSVGYAEVQLKAAQWAQLAKKQRKIELEHHVFPAVLGPGQDYFIIDHHHLGIALLEQGIKEVLVTVLDDLSWLEPAVFWRTLEFRSWSHPYDRQGRRRDYRDMPRRLTELEDDPYRSLAGLVRGQGSGAFCRIPVGGFLPFASPGTADQERTEARGTHRHAPGAIGRGPLSARLERQGSGDTLVDGRRL